MKSKVVFAILFLLSVALSTVAFSVKPAKAITYDLNGDGLVDIDDITIVAYYFGSFGPDYLYPGSPAHPRWYEVTNVPPSWNGDGAYLDTLLITDKVIDIDDMIIVAMHYLTIV